MWIEWQSVALMLFDCHRKRHPLPNFAWSSRQLWPKVMVGHCAQVMHWRRVAGYVRPIHAIAVQWSSKNVCVVILGVSLRQFTILTLTHIQGWCCNTDAPGLFSIHGSVQNGLQLIARLQIVSGIQMGVGNKSNWAYQCVLVNLMLWRLRVLLTLSLPLQKLALFVYLTTLGSAWTVPWSKRTERGAHDVARICKNSKGRWREGDISWSCFALKGQCPCTVELDMMPDLTWSVNMVNAC